MTCGSYTQLVLSFRFSTCIQKTLKKVATLVIIILALKNPGAVQKKPSWGENLDNSGKKHRTRNRIRPTGVRHVTQRKRGWWVGIQNLESEQRCCLSDRRSRKELEYPVWPALSLPVMVAPPVGRTLAIYHNVHPNTVKGTVVGWKNLLNTASFKLSFPSPL